MLIPFERIGKKQLEPGQESMGDVPVLLHCFLLIIIDHKRPVCRSIAVKNKPTAGSPFFGTFPSDRNAKATKDASVYFVINSGNSCKLYHRFPVNYTGEFL